MKERSRVSFGKTFTRGQTPWALLYLNVLLLISFSGCRGQIAPTDKTQKQTMAVNVVKLTRVAETVKTATFFGTMVPDRTLTMAFAAPGRIKSIVPHGQVVTSSTLLAELDVDDLEKQQQALQSQFAQASNQQGTEQIQQRIAGLTEQIQARRIVAPFDCVVDQVFAYENSLIRAQSPVLRIIDAKNPKIDISLPSRIARFVGADVEVYFGVDDKAVVGRLVEKSKVENAGSVACRFDIQTDLSDIDYRLGQTVEVRFSFQSDLSGYWVPLSALERSGEGIWSLLVAESNDGKSMVVRKLVTIIQITDDRVLVDGDQLDDALAISTGIHRVVPGQEVVPQSIQNGGLSREESAE